MQFGRWLDYLVEVEGFAVDLAEPGIEAKTINWSVSDNDDIFISESEIIMQRTMDGRMGDSETDGGKFYPVKGAGHVFGLDIDPGEVKIGMSGMEENKGKERWYLSVLAKALRDLRRVIE